MIEMRIVGVRVELTNQQPILLLGELSGPRSLPILIGQVEANAIAMHMEGMRPARPLTHDLLGNVIAALGRKVVQVRVVDFREGTYFGELAFDDGTTVSARPSDAVALAVRQDVPVLSPRRCWTRPAWWSPESGSPEGDATADSDEVGRERRGRG